VRHSAKWNKDMRVGNIAVDQVETQLRTVQWAKKVYGTDFAKTSTALVSRPYPYGATILNEDTF
jgi:hypothetical protein